MTSKLKSAGIKQYKNPAEYEDKRTLLDKFGDNKQRLSAWLASHYSLINTTHLLELGCGTGEIWRYLIDRVPSNAQLTLTDYSNQMLKATKALFASHEVTFSVKWQQVDVNQPLPFQANLFDVVMAHLMLYHADHMPQAVEHIATIIKPGGYFGVATLCPNSFIEHIKLAHKINNTIPPDGINIFTPEELESSLTKHFTKLYRYDYVNNIRWPTADSALRFSKTLLAISMHNPTEAFYSAYQNQLESIMTQQETFNTHQRVILFMAVK